MNVKWLYTFWGVMDSIFVGWFCYFAVAQGRIPFYSDIQSFFRLSAELESVSVVFFVLSFVLNVSIVFSMVFFVLRSDKVFYLVYAQAPLRLLLSVPSISLLLWLAKANGASSAAILVGLLLLSEIIKLCSVYFRRNLFSG